jgi:hypothetical protein
MVLVSLKEFSNDGTYELEKAPKRWSLESLAPKNSFSRYHLKWEGHLGDGLFTQGWPLEVNILAPS